MPIKSPLHESTSKLCTSMRFKDWAGYFAVCSFDNCHEKEYMALRHGAGIQDVTPLYKYLVYGDDATAFLSHIMTRNIAKLKPSQVSYCCWCDHFGKVIDDGTVTRLDENLYRVTAAEPTLFWFNKFRRGRKVEIRDISNEISAISLQGPNSRSILEKALDFDASKLKFFFSDTTRVGGFEVGITRTGYTGDLGYELWVKNEHANQLWSTLLNEGKDYGLLPNGLDALDMTRIEAGFIMNGVDYFSAHQCLIESRKANPYEIGLGWAVNLKRPNFAGKDALVKEKQEGSKWALAGLEIDFLDLEKKFAAIGLPPQLPHGAWREPACVYDLSGKLIGRATSGTWSPILKKNLALATLDSAYAKTLDKVKIEWMVEYKREMIMAKITKTPFFNPERKRA